MYRPSFSPRRAISVAAIAAAGVLGPVALLSAAGAPAAHAVTRTSTPRCTTSGLVVWMNTTGSGAAGTIYYHLEFTNLSGHRCTLRGYPGVSGVNLTGHRIGSAGSHNAIYPTTTITLANGATANALLGITEVGFFSSSACHPTTAAGLRVYPPNQTTSKVIPFPFGACAHPGPVYLHVAVVK
jgi:Protein of unknown function (DUF4232)